MNSPQSSNLFYLLIILLFSCNISDPDISIGDDEMPEPDPVATFSCKLDGQNFTIPELFIAGLSNLNGDVQTMVASGSRLTSSTTTIVTINLVTNDFANLAAGDTFDGTTPNTEAYAFGAVGINNPDGNEEASSEITNMCSLTITAIDRTTETFSGTFSFTAESTETGKTYVVTDGVFENVEYD